MEKQKVIYISGKMGEKVLSKATIKKFEVAQDKLVSEGWVSSIPQALSFSATHRKRLRLRKRNGRILTTASSTGMPGCCYGICTHWLSAMPFIC